MTHASVPKEDRDKLGITDGLIRLSCGLEGTDDLIKDLDQALKAVVSIVLNCKKKWVIMELNEILFTERQSSEEFKSLYYCIFDSIIEHLCKF